MPISRFPRFGQPLAPATLGWLLDVPVRSKFASKLNGRPLRVCELDASVWRRFSPLQCRLLADEVVDRVWALCNLGGVGIYCQPMPRPKRGLSLDDLELQRWTRNRLSDLLRSGELNSIQELGGWPLERLLRLKGFGTTCLVDLLVSVESAGATQISRATAQKAEGKVPKRPRRGAATGTCLEDELWALLDGLPPARTPEAKERNRRIAAAYFGFDGHGGETLLSIGRRYGLTRERVRQLCLPMVRHFRARRFPTPILDRIVEHVSARVPSLAGPIERELQRMKLTRHAFRLRGIMRCARFLGRRLPFAVTSRDDVRFVGPGGEARLAGIVSVSARGTVGRRGAATIGEVVASAAARAGTSVSEDLVRRTVQFVPGFSWLDKKRGMFWFGPANRGNRVQTHIRKILAVSRRIDVSRLREAIGRNRRMRSHLPPSWALLAICSKLPGVRTDGNSIIGSRIADVAKVLGTTEAVMVSVLREHGPALQPAAFRRFCVERGMNRGTFAAVLSFSPVIQRFEDGSYGLCGASRRRRKVPMRRSSE